MAFLGVAFDIRAHDDPTGAVLVRLTPSALVEMRYRQTEQGWSMTDGLIKIHTDHPAATAANLHRHNLVTPMLLFDGDVEVPVPGGFFLEEGDFDALSEAEQGGRELTFTGPNVVYYLARAILRETIFAPGQPRRGSIDVDRMWTWIDEEPGKWMTRGMEEGFYQPGPSTTAADSPLAHATWDFSRLVDSDGVAWIEAHAQYQFPWGDTEILDLWGAALKLGLHGRVGAALDFHLFQADPGVDRTTAVFAAAKVRFEPGNIATQIRRRIAASRERSAVLVDGAETATAYVTGGSSDVTWIGHVRAQETTDPVALADIGQHDLDERQIQADGGIPVKFIARDDELNGGYVPFLHLVPGDLVSLQTGTGAHDFTNFAINVAALSLIHDTAGNWYGVAELGGSYVSAESRAFDQRIDRVIRQATGHGHPEMLCRPTTIGAAAVDSGFWGGNTSPSGHMPPAGVNAVAVWLVSEDDTTASVTWDGVPMTLVPGSEVVQTTVIPARPDHTRGGWYIATNVTPGVSQFLTFTPLGQGYWELVWLNDFVEVAAVATAIGTSAAPAVSVSAAGGLPLAALGAWGGTDGAVPAPTAPATAIGDTHQNIVTGEGVLDIGVAEGDASTAWTLAGSVPWVASILMLSSGGSDGDEGPMPVGANGEADHGLSVRATRCDHVHPHSDLSDHPAETHHHASSSEVTPFGTIAATNVQAALEEIVSEATGAPTTADYLVGTAQAGLSAEIVVGATPGGELGGTWASPTVDATHSGSTHSDYMTVISGGGGTLHTHGNTGATETIDLALGNAHDLTLDAATVTLTLTGPAAGALREALLLLRQDGAGNRTVAWPASVAWPTAAPTLSTVGGDVDIVRLITLDGGTNWFGYHYGNYTPAAAATRYWPMLALTSD